MSGNKPLPEGPEKVLDTEEPTEEQFYERLSSLAEDVNVDLERIEKISRETWEAVFEIFDKHELNNAEAMAVMCTLIGGKFVEATEMHLEFYEDAEKREQANQALEQMAATTLLSLTYLDDESDGVASMGIHLGAIRFLTSVFVRLLAQQTEQGGN